MIYCIPNYISIRVKRYYYDLVWLEIIILQRLQKNTSLKYAYYMRVFLTELIEK